MQRYKRCANIPMNTTIMVNVVTIQCRRCYAGIPMNKSATMNILTTQLGTSCSFDSPGLARNEPTLGEHSQGDSTL
ncbi:tetrahydrofolate synthase [Segatella salivae]|uniref:tetrahydrofolate synthase n=1 Tax=Segatella salivae TaxID=228604 RepID=UPI002420181A|nr:tetrahydrofolate synthase [Segatella salivae]